MRDIATGMTSNGVTLSIVIVNWNTRDLLAASLESVAEEVVCLGQSEVETFVVDNASADGSVAMIHERFPWVHVIENSANAGFARANNQALETLNCRYALLLNSDTVVHENSLKALVNFMDEHAQVGAAGPLILNSDGTLQPSCYPMLTPLREFWRLTFIDKYLPLATYRITSWDTSTPRQVEVIKGACMIIRDEALEQVGLLDDSYFMYTEEMDLCYRLAEAGWQLWYVPDSVVTHHGEASSRQVAETMYLQLYKSKVMFHRKFGGPSRAIYFKTLLAIAYTPRAMFSTIIGFLSPQWRKRAHIFRRLLLELPKM